MHSQFLFFLEKIKFIQKYERRSKYRFEYEIIIKISVCFCIITELQKLLTARENEKQILFTAATTNLGEFVFDFND